ncbi:MAG: hypothetical protein WC834_06565 [Eubacteriales bacterium]
MFSNVSQLQQNLNQITQICNQLSQNEQANASKLIQMQEAERVAAQQLNHCAQLCQQVSQQVSQAISSSQYSNVSQPFAASGTSGFQTSAYPTGNWANRPINTNFATTGQYGGSTYQS